jgi:peptidyl-prolyl cis-trans isomerase B (cyclophilin B)
MQKIFRPLSFVVLAVLAVLIVGCGSLPTTANSSPGDSALSEKATSIPAGLPRLNGKATVEMVVKNGKVVLEVDGTNAPITAGNFVDLVQKGVYDGLVFHRVVREPEPFVVQAGDPQGKDPKFPIERLGTGGYTDPATQQPRNIPLEIKPKGATEPIYHQTFADAQITQPPVLSHSRGALAMARSNFPDSASSQFYITLGDVNFLDGNYAVFGYVKEGMQVVDTIERGDRIQSMRVTQGADNLQPAAS